MLWTDLSRHGTARLGCRAAPSQKLSSNETCISPLFGSLDPALRSLQGGTLSPAPNIPLIVPALFLVASALPISGLQGGTFHRDALSLREQVVPQHNYRLNAAALEGRHYGEESCRDHRQAVLAAMPHRCATPAAESVSLSLPDKSCLVGLGLPVGLS